MSQIVPLPAVPDLLGVFQLKFRWVTPPREEFPDLRHLRKKSLHHRTHYYGSICFIMVCCFFALGTGLLIYRNCRIRRNRDMSYTPLPEGEEKQQKDGEQKEQQDVEEQQAGKESDHMMKCLRWRWLGPVIVTVYLSVNGCVLYFCYRRDDIDLVRGAGWEYWLIWLFIGLLSGVVEVALLFGRPGRRPKRLYAERMLFTHLPLVSERVDAVKDLMFVFVAMREDMNITAGVAMSIVIISHAYFACQGDVQAELLETYLPILTSTDTTNDLAQQPAEDDEAPHKGFRAFKEEARLQILKQTSPARRAIVVAEDLPQSLNIAIFTLRKGGSPFVLASLFLSVGRLTLSTVLAHPIHKYMLEDLKRARERALPSGNSAKVLSLTRTLWSVDADIPAHEVRKAGWKPKRLREVEGFTTKDLRACGYTPAEAIEAGFTLAEAKAGGYTAAEARESGIAAAEMRASGYTVAEVKAGGYTAVEARAGGYTAGEIKVAGWTAAEAKESGFTVSQLRIGRYSVAELLGNGFSIAEVRDGGYTTSEMKAGGYTAVEAFAGGYTRHDIMDGFSDIEVNTACAIAAAGSLHNLVLHDDSSCKVFGIDPEKPKHADLCKEYGFEAHDLHKVPEEVASKKVRQVAAGSFHSIVVMEDGTCAAWGRNKDGESDVPDFGGKKVIQAAAGLDHSLVVLDDGTCKAWGSNSQGQCDVPDFGGKRAVQVAAGWSHSLVLLDDGSFKAWGQLYDGRYKVPQDELAGKKIVQVAAGSEHTLVVLDDGTCKAWGSNKEKQCDVPQLEGKKVVQAATGSHHCLVILDDGTCKAWGGQESHKDGRCEVPNLHGKKVVQVAAGQLHSLVVLDDGTCKTFGANFGGQCKLPEDLKDKKIGHELPLDNNVMNLVK